MQQCCRAQGVNMQEEWKQVGDANYSISNHGRLYCGSNGCITLGNIVGGYRQFHISYNGVRRTEKLHRLVAKAFIPNPFSKSDVNHIDGNRLHNHVINLEWATRSENVQHAYDTGLMPRGTHRVESVLVESELPTIIKLMLAGKKDQEIADEYGVTRQSINAIRIGDNWKHLGLTIPGRYNGAPRTRKITAEDVPYIRECIKNGKLDAEIAVEFGSHPSTIRQIRIGNTWKNY